MICAYVPFWGPIMRCSRGVGSLKHRSGLSSRWGLGFNLCFGVEAGVCLRLRGHGVCVESAKYRPCSSNHVSQCKKLAEGTVLHVST